MSRQQLSITAGLLLVALGADAQAALAVFTDKATFLSATGASSASGALPNLGEITDGSETLGSVTIQQFSDHTLYIGTAGVGISDWTALLTDNEIAISGTEDIDFMTAAPVFSLGFDFVEPATGGGTPGTCFVPNCIDSLFTVTLKAGAATVGSFDFNAQDDIAAFVGVWSDVAFDAVLVREIIGSNDDEFFGELYTGNVALVPVPAAGWLLLSAAGLLAGRRRKV